MVQVIECGERTIQTKCRIAITDIANKYDLKPGDSVIVDLRLKEGKGYDSDLWDETPRIIYGKEIAYCDRVLTHLQHALEDESVSKETRGWIKRSCKMLKLHIESLESHLKVISD